MPIRWKSKVGRRGKLAASLSAWTASMAGASTSAPTLSGVIHGLLYDWTGAVAGVVQASSAVTGQIAASMSSWVGSFAGSASPSSPDTTAPTVPTGLAAVATSTSQINLSWNASTDPAGVGQVVSGVASYRIYRGGVLLTTVAVPALTYSDTGLTASTAYSYTVSAVDAAGNASAQCAPVSRATNAPSSDVPYSPSTWGGVINTQALHESRIPGTNTPHFERTWLTAGSWSPTEGYMRWRVNATQPEDDDGYDIAHPVTATRGIYLSFVGRVGSTWWSHHSSADRFKFVMFYPSSGVNPRPTIFNMPIFAGNGGAYSYRTWGPDLEAGGSGVDEFGTGAFDWNLNYPNHTYQEGPAGHSQWYFYVMSLETDRTKVYLWTQDGSKSGAVYAQSQLANASMLSSWNAQTWSRARLLAYIEATTVGDANSYMDISHIRVTQSLPSPPAGFLL